MTNYDYDMRNYDFDNLIMRKQIKLINKDELKFNIYKAHYI